MSDPSSLPQAGEWEVDVVRRPSPGTDEETTQLLVVVDRQSGLVRTVAPANTDAEITAELITAIVAPPPEFEPGRPEVIWCRRESLTHLATAAVRFDIRLRATDSLPGVQSFVEVMGEMSIDPSFVPEKPELWRPLMERAIDLAPWTLVSDLTKFIFVECAAELNGRVAVFIGQLGENHGLVIFEDAGAFARFLDDDDPRAMLRFSTLSVHFNRQAVLPDHIYSEIESAGLVYREQALTLMKTGSGRVHPADPVEQEVCAAALEGVLAMVEVHGATLDEESVGRSSIPTVLGPLSVIATPPHLELAPRVDLLDGIDYRYIFRDRSIPELVIKLARQDALALARALEDADEVMLLEGPDSDELVVYADGGTLGFLPAIPDTVEWSRWIPAGGWLRVASGGVRRAKVRNSDIVLSVRVDFDIDDDDFDDFDDFDEEDDDEDPATQWPESAWDGPPQSWPPAADILASFAAPLKFDRMALDEARLVLDFAAMLFSAVSLADLGEPATLDDLRAKLGDSGPELDGLVARKRTWFADDTRIFQVADVTEGENGYVHLDVEAAIPIFEE